LIKAVFFDLYQTLVGYEPPREEVESKILTDFGIAVSPEALRRPLLVADEFIYNEIARRPLSARSREETAALYIRHQEIMLKEAGVKLDSKLALTLLERMRQTKLELVLFDDVRPALDTLKKRGLVLGLISNVEQDMSGTLDKLGLSARLTVVVTSQEAGAGKPRPEIFLYALQQAGITPSESIYVGDQYQVDVLGARGAGLKAILLDRTGYHNDITDCPRIRLLTELTGYVA
jgi:putative hydrolase of the HAD superfamily